MRSIALYETNNILKVVEKELSYEQLAIREEILREAQEEKELQKQMQREKEKQVIKILKNFIINKI